MSWLTSILGNPAAVQSAQGNLNAVMGAEGLTPAGQGILSGILPTLQRQATGGAPGFGPTGLATMQNQALSGVAAKTGASAEEARLRALRSNNPASLNATGVAIAGEGARAAGGTLQDILAQNEMLKAKQQEAALRQTGEIGTSDINAGLKAMSEAPGALEAMLKAQSAPAPWMSGLSNWFNLGGQALGDVAKAAAL